MTPLRDRIEELAGPAVAQAIRAEFGGGQCYIPSSCGPMASALAEPRDVVVQAVEDAYEEQVRNLISQAVFARSQEELHESLSKVEQLGLQRQRVLDWRAAQKTTCSGQ